MFVNRVNVAVEPACMAALSLYTGCQLGGVSGPLPRVFLVEPEVRLSGAGT